MWEILFSLQWVKNLYNDRIGSCLIPKFWSRILRPDSHHMTAIIFEWLFLILWGVIPIIPGVQRKQTNLFDMGAQQTHISLRIRINPCGLIRFIVSASKKLYILTAQHALSEVSDQTVRMRRLIWIFAGRTCPKVNLEWLLYFKMK